jgi:hypothetical protein
LTSFVSPCVVSILPVFAVNKGETYKTCWDANIQAGTGSSAIPLKNFDSVQDTLSADGSLCRTNWAKNAAFQPSGGGAAAAAGGATNSAATNNNDGNNSNGAGAANQPASGGTVSSNTLPDANQGNGSGGAASNNNNAGSNSNGDTNANANANNENNGGNSQQQTQQSQGNNSNNNNGNQQNDQGNQQQQQNNNNNNKPSNVPPGCNQLDAGGMCGPQMTDGASQVIPQSGGNNSTSVAVPIMPQSPKASSSASVVAASLVVALTTLFATFMMA